MKECGPAHKFAPREGNSAEFARHCCRSVFCALFFAALTLGAGVADIASTSYVQGAVASITSALEKKAKSAHLAPVAFSGDYNDLDNQPLSVLPALNITNYEQPTGRTYMGLPTYIRAFQGDVPSALDSRVLLLAGVTRIVSWGGMVANQQLGYYMTLNTSGSKNYTAYLLISGGVLYLRYYISGSGHPYDIWVEYTKN